MAFWDKIVSRGNVEDRRNLIPVVGGLSLTGIAILLYISLLTGADPAEILSQLEDVPTQNQASITREDFEGDDKYEVFASTVLGSNNDIWKIIFDQRGLQYTPPKLVLFRIATESSCGTASSSVGPHYCRLDETIYLDETFFDELTNRFDAKGGDVAEAYVISHEVGHHIQNRLGIFNDMESKNGKTSVQIELQADCFAGLWANSIKNIGVFEQGEIVEAMDAAAAVGDDRIQEKVTGYTNPETWTHGSSDERVGWFNRGFETGNFAECDTSDK